MRILLDTHIAIWMFEDNPKLSQAARSIVISPDNRLFVSPVSTWEVALKHAKRPQGNIGAGEFVELCREAGLEELPLRWKHALGIAGLPDVHGDPFDRMLLAQAREENMRLLTHDGMLARYGADEVISV